ncbi:MAG: aldo/keto reductase [Oscillospiraceae bacterium]|nr:aldo/keto reductase [Oscillospiraceae bacterium]
MRTQNAREALAAVEGNPCELTAVVVQKAWRKTDAPSRRDIAQLGAKYGKTPAQVILRWHTQMGFAVIPGSRNVDHIRDNLNILDFRLTDDEMAQVAALDKGERYYHRTDEQLVAFAGWKPAFEEQ